MKIRNRMRIEKNRIEAFSDGVMAIIVTIMMLNIPLPGSYSRESLTAFLFNIAVFFVSFIVVGAQWVKHLQLFTMCRDISEKVLWRNLLHLFFLSLMPLFTKWIMENPGRVLPPSPMMCCLLRYSSPFICCTMRSCWITKGLMNFAGACRTRI